MITLIILTAIVAYMSGFCTAKIIYSPEKEPKIEDLDGFYIEHYPLSGRYYPKYKRHYLTKQYPSGVICIEDECEFGASFNNQKAAEAFIDKAKEHLFKKGIQTIKYIK